MQKGQGAMEYLLLIGGALLIGVIVIALLINVVTPAGAETVLATASQVLKTANGTAVLAVILPTMAAHSF